MDQVIIKTEGGEFKSVELNKLYKIKFHFGVRELERPGSIIMDDNNFFFTLPSEQPGGEEKHPGRYKLYAEQNDEPVSNNNPIIKIFYAIEPTLITSIEEYIAGGGKRKKRKSKKMNLSRNVF